MLSKAKAKYIRMSPRKVRLVMELIKGKTVADANAILGTLNKRASGPIKKVIDSALANINFDRQEKLLEKDIVISKIRADGGPMLTRYRAATMGRATPIRHRTVHIGVELDAAVVKAETENKQSESK